MVTIYLHFGPNSVILPPDYVALHARSFYIFTGNPVIISKFNKNNYGLCQTLQYNEEITSYQLLGIQYAVYLPV